MSFLNLIYENTPTAINVNNVLSVSYREGDRQLTIEFTTGKVMVLTGDEADRLWEIFSYEPEEEEEEGDVDEFEEVNEQLAEIENQLRNNTVTGSHETYSLLLWLSRLDRSWDAKKKKELGGQLKELKKRVEVLHEECEVAAELHTIDECETAPVITSLSTKSIIRRLDDAANVLRDKHRFTPEVQQKVRAIKERIARERAKKKLADAGVAEAGGSTVKAGKLRKEAAAVLKQDWASIFPNESTPDIESLEI
jgi:hypothetical protein